MKTKASCTAGSRERLIGIFAIIWIAILGLSLAWNWHQAGKSAILFAASEARNSYNKDPWETEALSTLSAGNKDVVSLETMEGQPYLLLMSPLFTEKPCLTCHAARATRKGISGEGSAFPYPLPSTLRQPGSSGRSLFLPICSSVAVAFGGYGMGIPFSVLQRQVF
ncbi:MAG: hypothetical protein ACD_75C00522G0009 [uncultured bacterium]|nr:MAG: hypothetical protein ACD_75C00522G0009 [uncultured bacterium]